jgi:hypothetical protein
MEKVLTITDAVNQFKKGNYGECERILNTVKRGEREGSHVHNLLYRAVGRIKNCNYGIAEEILTKLINLQDV